MSKTSKLEQDGTVRPKVLMLLKIQSLNGKIKIHYHHPYN